jgi:hypothetical protein
MCSDCSYLLSYLTKQTYYSSLNGYTSDSALQLYRVSPRALLVPLLFIYILPLGQTLHLNLDFQCYNNDTDLSPSAPNGSKHCSRTTHPHQVPVSQRIDYNSYSQTGVQCRQGYAKIKMCFTFIKTLVFFMFTFSNSPFIFSNGLHIWVGFFFSRLSCLISLPKITFMEITTQCQILVA